MIDALGGAICGWEAGGGRSGDVVWPWYCEPGEGNGPADLPHLFERFYRADAARGHDGGSGIGLTIVDSIVRAHGGSVHADSGGRGTGTRFTIRRPTARAAHGLIGS